MSRWSDDYMTADERREALAYERAVRMDRAEEQAAQGHSVRKPQKRHTGTDKALHHWSEIINDPQFDAADALDYDPDDPLGDKSENPLDVMARTAVDQYTAYETKQAKYAEQEQKEARAWLDRHRPVNLGPW